MIKNFPWIALLLTLLLAGCEQKNIVIHHDADGAADAVPVAEKMTLPEKVSFNEHIQPILSEYCYHCHGPDAEARKPEKEPLRFDIEKDAFAVRDSGAPVIIKGKPEESELVKRILSKDKDEVMPPPESHKTLKPREMALLEKWIAQGAEFEGHWSYQPVARVTPPANDWSDKPIDGFIFEKLADAGLKPNPPEDPRRFHRRLSFDLTGLPPKPAETDAFVAAYEKDAEAAVSAEADRMLSTMANAEHFARQWLDAARYADTHGIHIDNYRAIWPYRDWVVNAFKENMKWDKFTTEQMAGDLLPNPTLDQKIATGFLRCLATTGEGGAIPEEYDAIYATDRVDTMGAIWLGLTASCASCHDHKFDPFSTKEFYQFTSFFRNNTMSALDGNDANHPPSIFVPQIGDREKLKQVAAGISELDGQLAKRRNEAGGDYEKWLASFSLTQGSETDSTLAIHLPLSEDGAKITGKVDGVAQEWPVAGERIDGPLGKALVVSSVDLPLGDIGGFSRTDTVSYGGFVWIEGKPTGAIIAKMDSAKGFRGWDIYVQGGQIGSHVIDTWEGSANKTISNNPLEQKKWQHVMVTFDGRQSGHQAMSVYIDGKRVPVETKPNTVGGTIETAVPLRLGSREGGDSKLSGGKVAFQDFRFYRRLLDDAEIERLANAQKIQVWASKPKDQRTKEEEQGLLDHYITTVDAPSLELLKQKDALKRQDEEIRSRGSQTLVYEEKKDSKPSAYVLIRGAYASKGDQVFPNTPAMLPPMPEGAPKDRLGLAQWLNDPKNPLPARVTMNRLWSYMFGTGIVETNGNFGILGARPTHPKLLDWLASEFIASGWDYHHMAKLIVTSAAYRQAGAITPEKLEKDPANRLLSRGPRTRLDAEQIRDLALDSAGILSEKIGGPPVKPYQPEGTWSSVAMPQSNTKDYKQDTGEALYRRSLYTFWKRTAAPPTMEILNAPTREKFCVGRERTNTPLQALAMMNDPQFVEASRVLATKAVEGAKDFDARLDFITLRLLGRKLDDQERTYVKTTLGEAAAYYTAKPEEASKAIAVGELKPDKQAPSVELAAWTLVAGQLFNLDETITR